MDELIKRLRERAAWLESRSFATLSGELEREAADAIDKLLFDSEAAKINFDMWMEADSSRKNERQLRIDYQDIVYRICNIVDAATGRHTTKGNGTTIETVVPVLEKLLKKERDANLRGMIHDTLEDKYCT